IVLDWEAYYESGYRIEGSVDNALWSPIAQQANNSGCMEEHVNIDGEYRYIRITRDQVEQGWGYSLWELSIYGRELGETPPLPTVTPSPTPTSPPEIPNINITSPTNNQQFSVGSNISFAITLDDANWFA